MVLEMKIIKQALEFEECLKQRLEFICEICIGIVVAILIAIPCCQSYYSKKTIQQQ